MQTEATRSPVRLGSDRKFNQLRRQSFPPGSRPAGDNDNVALTRLCDLLVCDHRHAMRAIDAAGTRRDRFHMKNRLIGPLSVNHFPAGGESFQWTDEIQLIHTLVQQHID